jgi:hypothetical protein
MSDLENKDSIPEVAKKQGDKADQLHRQLYPDQYPEAKKEEPKPGEGTPASSETPKPGETPKPEEKPKEEAKEAPKPPEPAKEEDWKQKYETLQGKYNAEVPQLHMTVASLQNALKQMQGEIGSLKAAKEIPPPPKEEPKKEPAPGNKNIEALRDEYPDIYEAVVAMIESSKGGAGSPKGEEKPAEKRSVGAPAPSASTDPRATFGFYLNRDVPDWEQVNVDPEFHRFLQTPDPKFPGMTKLQSIQAGYDAVDFTTVVGHFRDFKASKAAPPAAPSNPNNQTPGGSSPEEKFLAPPKGGRGGTPPSSETPTVTPADIKKFYADASRGLWGPLEGEKYRKEEARLLGALTGKKT